MPRSVLAPALAAALAVAVDAPAQEPNFDPGHTLLSRVAQAYKALPGYADEGSVTLSFSVAGDDETQTIAKPFAFARPDRLAVSLEPAAFHLDGSRQVSALAGLYLVADPPESLTIDVLARDPAASYIFGGITGIPSMTLFHLLASEDPYQAILQGVERLEREPERSVDGIECRALRIVPQAGPTVRLLIDPQSHLIRRIEVVPNTGEIPADVKIKEISWSPGTITAGVPPADRFSYQPPDGSRQVESLAALMAGPDGEPLGDELQGRPAPDFALDLLAADGQLERVAKADLAGKVVLIDVWATWCAPCQPELQELDALLDRYETGPKADRLRVISLSIDTPPPSEDDPPEEQPEGSEADERPDTPDPTPKIRAIVEDHLKAGDLQLDRPPFARVAIDPRGTATEALGIRAIPMLILIDPQGVVRSVHVGAPPRVVRELAAAIDAMLDAPTAAGPGGGAD